MIPNLLLRALRAIEARRLRVVVVMHVDDASYLYGRLSEPAVGHVIAATTATPTAIKRHVGARDALADAMEAHDL